MFEIFNKTHDTMNIALGVLDSISSDISNPDKFNQIAKKRHFMVYDSQTGKYDFAWLWRGLCTVWGGQDNKWK